MNLQIRNLSKFFDGKVIFSDFSYIFPKKGIVQVKGDSGIGKTTLLRIISGLDKHYTGDVICEGTVSYAFQEYRLFPWLSAIDNVTIASFAQASEEDVASSCKLLYRLGFKEDDLKLKPQQLSGGMKQRVSLARAIMRGADILLLDEPTKELDKELTRTAYSLVSEYATEHLVILVTHEDISDILSVKDTIQL